MTTIEQEKEIMNQICPICKAKLNDELVCTICDFDWNQELLNDYGIKYD